MHESLIVKYCSPTLAGFKTGSLFSCYFDCIHRLEIEMKKVNSMISLKGVHIRLLRTKENKALIYVYRPDKLMEDLLQDESKEILYKKGYGFFDVNNCVNKLSKRLNGSQGFPHEIGLFLGYPPNDVRGFIENNGKNFKLLGHWKVYSDATRAKKIFEKYRKCTKIYCKRLSEGLSIQRLTVNV